MHRPPAVAPTVLVQTVPMPVWAQSATPAAASPSSPNLNAEPVP